MFSLIDYGILITMIALSCAIGIYFGCTKKQKTAAEYLLGGSNMKVVPIAMSFIASHVSGVTLLAIPADVYLYGGNAFFSCISFIIIGLLTFFLYLPVLMKLKVPSGFEYFNLRFNKSVRTLASFLFTIQVLILNPVMAYLPAIAFSQVTGIDSKFISPVISIVCMFYTTIGGFKAVIWTDVIQLPGIVVTMLIIFFLGVNSAGGFGSVWSKAVTGNRLNFDFDPTIRDGFWPITTSFAVIWLGSLCFNPSSVQKYLSTSNLMNAKRVVVIVCFGVICVFAFTIFTGLILYANYENCDPLASGKITKPDQIVIQLFLDIAGNIPGLTGIFIAGILSAGLSTLSTYFNTLAATVYGDFVLPYMPRNISPKTERRILQLIVVMFGLLCTFSTFVMEYFGNVLHFVSSGQGCMSGLQVGLYSLGMLFPMANSKGAIWGTIIGFAISFWIALCNQWYKFQGAFDYFIKPLSVEGCNFDFNLTTLTLQTNTTTSKPFILYRLSHWYNSLISFTLVILVGLVVSYITKRKEEVPDPELISPFTLLILKKIGKKDQAEVALCLAEQNVTVPY